MSIHFRHNYLLIIAILAIMYFLLPSSTFAATYYIDPSSVYSGNGTHVRNNSISNAVASGIFLSNSGCNDVIANNTIHDVAADGIVINGLACTNNAQTLISGNTIYNTGIHGIELDGNFFIVDHNIIHAFRASRGAAPPKRQWRP